MTANLIEFDEAEIFGFPNAACKIVNFSTSMAEYAPILVFSHGDQRVACSYIRAGYRRDPSNRQREKSRLMANLLRFVRASQGPASEAPVAESQIQLNAGALGKPELCVDGHEGLSVSFAHTATSTWGALCWTGGAVGVDVASGDEFPYDYPFHRAFHDEEFTTALKITGGNISEAAALLWTEKEAVVKCIGTAFHLVNPLELRVAAIARHSEKYDCKVCFDDRVFERLPELSGISIVIFTFTEQGARVSVAVTAENGAANSYNSRSRSPKSSEFVAMQAVDGR
jgi:phosphopantetheinyl transferase